MQIQATITIVCLLVLLPLTTNAQTGSGNPNGNRQLHFFVSKGEISGIEIGPRIPVPDYSAWQIGGAAEWFLRKGLAANAELAVSPKINRGTPIRFTYRTPSGTEGTNTIAANGILGWSSFNLAYHFQGPITKGKLVPFVTAGGTLLARGGIAEAGNFGGGLSLWSNSHLGMRLEYRKYILREPFPEPRFRSMRLGLVLR